jgi:predicted dehydrogenase
MANLRAGLIGLGMMGRHHARVLSLSLIHISEPTRPY